MMMNKIYREGDLQIRFCCELTKKLSFEKVWEDLSKFINFREKLNLI